MATVYHFDQSAEVVFDKLTDPDFLVKRCVALGEKQIECEMESDGHKTQVVLTRTVKRELPAVLAKLFGDENRMTMTEDWEQVGNSWLGTYEVKVHGQPVVLNARFSLKPASSGCDYEISYRCKARIPMVGGKVEKFILSQTEEGMRQEMDYLKQELAG
jgi:hypothetical protein